MTGFLNQTYELTNIIVDVFEYHLQLSSARLAVRQAQSIDTESEPEEAPSKAEELQPLGARVPLVSEEFEDFEPSGTRTDSSHSSASSYSIAPLSLDHPLTHVSPTPTPTRASFHLRTTCMIMCSQPAMSPGHSARVAEVMALSDSAFCKRYRSSYETPSPSLTLPVRKRYRGTSELILDTDSEGDELGHEDTDEDEEDKSLDADDEREIRQRMRVWFRGEGGGGCTRGSAAGSPGCGYSHGVYTDILVYVPPVAPVQTPPSLEWSSGSFPVSPPSPVVPSPIASPVATPTATISVDEDQFIEVGAQLELHRSILHDHTQRLDALPPTLFVDIDLDVRELYTRSGAVRDEIFSHRYRLRSLEREHERVVVTFRALWRPMLALEAWAGQTDAQRAALWHAIYDI
ncbi:hypothetical protein Tco_0718031 [Tanacetum coccineum]